MHNNTDEFWMQKAIELAEFAELSGEVPVGAVVVQNNKIIGKGYNKPITTNDPTSHAEIIAIRDAGKKLNNYRLSNTTLYVTLEPCVMCIGAIIHARINRLVFGAYDPKTGSVGSKLNLLREFTWNHVVEYSGNILGIKCGCLLTNFFSKKRIRQ